MSRNSSNAAASAVEGATKLCHIVKRPDFEGYGFNLHSEKIKPGQYIGKVDANSPAEEAGLKEGDRIIEVNGVSIGTETHKQVVQRIKAIANEVRLLLIDVDNKGAGSDASAQTPTAIPKTPSTPSTPTTPITATIPTTNGKAAATAKTTNGNIEEYHGTKQEMPGASANISSISMVSTKRISNASSHESNNNSVHSEQHGDDNSMDVTDHRITTMPATNHALSDASLNGTKRLDNNNMTTTKSATASAAATPAPTLTTPPPPSAAIATVPQQHQSQRTSTNYTNTSSTAAASAAPPAAAAAAAGTTAATTNSLNRVGSLQLPMTAAEMRAKLLSKKKYDPKNESVDLKKKFDIIQKL